jgi:probable FeS assembly SUF system protein SufT
MTHQEVELIRDCPVTAIPAGTALTLPKGERVFVTQTLGGSATVRTGMGLFRIAREDVDALGGAVDLEERAAGEAAGEFSEEAVWGALRGCFDPEIPVNIVDLGLIYDLSIEEAESGKKNVFVQMTLTAPGCGMGPVIAQDAKLRIEALPQVETADVRIVWDPVWNPGMISGEGRKILGLE